MVNFLLDGGNVFCLRVIVLLSVHQFVSHSSLILIVFWRLFHEIFRKTTPWQSGGSRILWGRGRAVESGAKSGVRSQGKLWSGVESDEAEQFWLSDGKRCLYFLQFRGVETVAPSSAQTFHSPQYFAGLPQKGIAKQRKAKQKCIERVSRLINQALFAHNLSFVDWILCPHVCRQRAGHQPSGSPFAWIHHCFGQETVDYFLCERTPLRMALHLYESCFLQTPGTFFTSFKNWLFLAVVWTLWVSCWLRSIYRE